MIESSEVILGIIKSREVFETMLKIDPHEFSDINSNKIAYTLVLLIMILKEILKNHLLKAERVLDIGTDHGYLAVAMLKMMKGLNATVVGVEDEPEKVNTSIENLNK